MAKNQCAKESIHITKAILGRPNSSDHDLAPNTADDLMTRTGVGLHQHRCECSNICRVDDSHRRDAEDLQEPPTRSHLHERQWVDEFEVLKN
eukprot:CAMPEP_0206630608 /NCGR_PEP_ID=MMETSP0325_2-20121206/67678_1 /ASSEMBLY_ACC=CAM_ASM_000347 /TAXON_ID=2866 /ORGANISM="Crypthecodinium cohnii, Strain Seligo" /LENGTH=91 /DNA_ID=CAMNT_0054155507 /DNA_START=859 /DNA_END=1131 /DNA_ORIENTATION=+